MWPVWSPLPWILDIGLLWSVGALAALAFGLADRRPLLLLTTVVLGDLLIPGSPSAGYADALTMDANRTALHLLALCVVAPAGALGLRALSETALANGLFGARPLGALVAMLAVAGCLASAEDSLRILEQNTTNGAQAWTEEALLTLPEDALVLTRSPSWGARLLAAQALGERPDVLVVPLSEVTQPATMARWLAREPALDILLRDLSTLGQPTERAMARLSDKRPLFVELDASWDKRLLEHVEPRVPLAHFSSHALGRSDRLLALEHVTLPLARVRRSVENDFSIDVATEQILVQNELALKTTLSRIGDKRTLYELEKLKPTASTESKPEPPGDSAVAAR
jgi:hypothetical protein